MNKKYCTLKEAQATAAKKGIEASEPTIRKWCRENNLGHQLGGTGKWFIDIKKFKEFINGGQN